VISSSVLLTLHLTRYVQISDDKKLLILVASFEYSKESNVTVCLSDESLN